MKKNFSHRKSLLLFDAKVPFYKITISRNTADSQTQHIRKMVNVELQTKSRPCVKFSSVSLSRHKTNKTVSIKFQPCSSHAKKNDNQEAQNREAENFGSELEQETREIKSFHENDKVVLRKSFDKGACRPLLATSISL